MKDKILFLILGILIGAIITTGVFMVLGKNNGGNNQNRPDMQNFRKFDPNNIDQNNLPMDNKPGKANTNTTL